MFYRLQEIEVVDLAFLCALVSPALALMFSNVMLLFLCFSLFHLLESHGRFKDF